MRELRALHTDHPLVYGPQLLSGASQKTQKVFGLLTSVNKGSTFRIVLNRMILPRLNKGSATKITPIVFVVGDGVIDMPMLRPDLEAQAVGPATQTALDTYDQRSISVQVPVLKDDSEGWELSIIPAHSVLDQRLGGDYIAANLRHPKIMRAEGWGVTGMINTNSTF